ADPGVTLASQGVLAGYQIRQPDQGSQWVHEFNDTALDVQSAGPAPVRVLLGPGDVRELTPEAVPTGLVVDTLGAGDVLHGAMAAALAGGAGPLDALAAGVRTATASVRHRGALGWTG
uniref:PfkB family carbohydrate kinase n=1 Tax=Cellulomonas citrea TaxID=1909423 RepID=UPI001F43AFEB